MRKFKATAEEKGGSSTTYQGEILIKVTATSTFSLSFKNKNRWLIRVFVLDLTDWGLEQLEGDR
jgi:hypothetical protein